MRTIGARLGSVGGIAPGFDRLRLVLASLVIVIHSQLVISGTGTVDSVSWLPSELVVPAFFALSGFLVTASAAHHSFGRFVANRVLRIMPALAASVAITALVIGPAVTELPLREYFASPDVPRYFLNIFGHVVLTLPGVFEQLPDAGIVNVSLWTVRWELLCYAVVACGIALGVRRFRHAVDAFAISVIVMPSLALLLVVVLGASGSQLPDLGAIAAPHASYFIEPVPLLYDYRRAPEWFLSTVSSWNFRIVPFFFAGSLAYRWRHRLPDSTRVAAAMAVLLIGMTLAVPQDWNGPVLYLTTIAPVTYLVAWAGMRVFRPWPLLDHGDCSYGIYLYGFPVQQLVQQAGLDSGSLALNIAVSLPITFVVAQLSWHLIENPLTRFGSRASRRFADGVALPRTRPRMNAERR